MVVEADAVGSRTNSIYERLIGGGRLDGMIVAFASIDDDLVAQLGEREIPLVLVNRRTSRVHGSVVVDDERGSKMAVQHLVGLGHRRIGFLGLDADTDTARRRLHGYGSAMAEAGIAIEPRWLAAGPPTESGGRSAAVAVLDANRGNPPTAFFVASLMSAIGALASARERGPRRARRRLAGRLQRPPLRRTHGAAPDHGPDAQLQDGRRSGPDAA